jgi:hypothetical protein
VKLILQAAHKTISTAIPESPSLVSLAVIVVALAVAIVISMRRPPSRTERAAAAQPVVIPSPMHRPEQPCLPLDQHCPGRRRTHALRISDLFRGL